MKITFAALAISALLAGIPAASATGISGSPALALAAVAAAHSPLLSPADKNTVAAIFDGKGAGPYNGKITVIVDKIVCRIGNVDITARSCELTFGKKTQSLTGSEANELYATEAMAGVPSDGAAGSIFESLSRLKCTLDPVAIKRNDGSGAECSYDPAK